MLYQQLEHPLIPVLMAIERAGVRIDGPALASQSQNIDAELNRLARRVYDLSGEEFNINSPKKLGEILFDKLGLKTETLRRTSKTQGAFDGVRGARGARARARVAAAGARMARAA